MLQSKKTNVKEEVKEEQKKELKECLVLWKYESKNNTEYLTGVLSEDPNVKVIGFFNGNKKNPNEPDIRIYVKEDDKIGQEIASLWATLGKNKKDYSYLTGKDDDNNRLVAFYSNDKNTKKPYIKVYYQN